MMLTRPGAAAIHFGSRPKVLVKSAAVCRASSWRFTGGRKRGRTARPIRPPADKGGIEGFGRESYLGPGEPGSFFLRMAIQSMKTPKTSRTMPQMRLILMSSERRYIPASPLVAKPRTVMTSPTSENMRLIGQRMSRPMGCSFLSDYEVEHDARGDQHGAQRSEEHTSELQSLRHLVCRLLLEK